jgi:hypothetical protein
MKGDPKAKAPSFAALRPACTNDFKTQPLDVNVQPKP